MVGEWGFLHHQVGYPLATLNYFMYHETVSKTPSPKILEIANKNRTNQGWGVMSIFKRCESLIEKFLANLSMFISDC